MSKESTQDTDDDRDHDESPALPAHVKNYVTPSGHAALRDELRHLMQDERPKVVEIVSWAASNGDRSENADYLYGKRRLREIDRRVRYLTKRLDSAVVVDNAGKNHERVYFGATVTVADDESGSDQTVTIVGVDEIDLDRGRVSWVSPIATALLKGSVGDTVTLRTPRGNRELEIIDIRYDELP